MPDICFRRDSFESTSGTCYLYVLSVMPADMTPCLARRFCRSFVAVDLQIDLWKIKQAEATDGTAESSERSSRLPHFPRKESVQVQLCDAHQTDGQMMNSNNTWLLAVMQLIVFGRREPYHDGLSYQEMFCLEMTKTVKTTQGVILMKAWKAVLTSSALASPTMSSRGKTARKTFARSSRSN